MGDEKSYVELNDGEVVLWIGQGSSIAIKAVTALDDPVELSSEDASALAEYLQCFARKIAPD